MRINHLIPTALLALMTLAAAGSLLAQSDAEIEVGRADLAADRQAIVAANLTLTETEAAAFWPLYREYHAEFAKIGDNSVQLIKDYAKSYGAANVTNEQALQMSTDFLKLQKAQIELKQKYVGKFSKILPGKSVMRFFQIENKLDTIVAMGVVSEIPLVE